MAFQITSSAFRTNGSIPRQYTCEGADSPPPLAWTGIPENTRSLALIVDDPDAPDPKAPERTYVHWVLYNLRPVPTVLGPELPPGALEGTNDWNRTGYGGPCPPIGRHRYFFKLYALDTILADLSAPTKGQLEEAMEGHIIARTDLIGTYEKSGG
jgi:Raf kinase inhibitor-like YbhB/YbcL family protein